MFAYRDSGDQRLQEQCLIISPPAGSLASHHCWRSVSSWCVSATKEKLLIGSLTLTHCQPLTLAPPTSRMMSWLFCPPAYGDELWSNGRRCRKSTHLTETSSGKCVTHDTGASCLGCVRKGVCTTMVHDDS